MRRALLSAGVAVLASELVLGQAPQPLTFEVASVRPSPPVTPTQSVYFGPARGGPGTPDPVQITWSYVRLLDLLMKAYDVKAYQISGPAWMATERYHVIAKVPEGTTKEQVNTMWQNLLAERFEVVLRHESKEFQVDELVVASGGPKLKETSWDPATPLPPGPPQWDKDGGLASPGQINRVTPGENGMLMVHAVAKAQPISQLTTSLTNQLNHPVLDKTGLVGQYDYTLDYTMNRITLPPPPPGLARPEPATIPGNASEPGPDLVAVVQRQLGLRLVRSKAMLDILVIDKADKIPTAN